MLRFRKALLAASILTVCALVSAACGQKANVHLSSASGPAGSSGSDGLGGSGTGTDTGAGTANDGGSTATGVGTTSGGGTTSGSGTSSSGGTTSAGGGTSASGGTTSGGTTSGGTSGGGPTAAGDSTGVSGDTITIGIHAPASGAGAPAASFYKYKQAYFDAIGKTINGRHVNVEFADDGYNPSQAVQACKSLVQDKKVFLLVGGGGVDQIVECAKYAASVGVPYLAEGVTEQGLGRLPNYFAESMTYPAQGKLLASYIKNVTGKTKWAMIRANTGNFDDAHTAFASAANAAGLTKVYDNAVPKDADNSVMQTEARNFCTAAGGDASSVALYPLMAPKLFIAFANFAASQGCFPRYAGIGITLGLNVVAQTVCPNNAFKSGATFFSPFQGLDAADAAFTNGPGKNADADDIAYGLWAAEKLVGEQLRAGGRNLTRQSFIQGVINQKVFDVGTYPKVDFAGGRFGGTAVHVLEADCPNQKYKTQSVNRSSF